MPTPIEKLGENMKDINRLVDIHNDLTGNQRGRRWGVEVLNKSSVVLLTACWEAFVEDLAESSFEFLLSKAKGHKDIPNKVRALASKPLKDAPDETKIWNLAENGWKSVLQDHKALLVNRHIGKLNTPKPENINQLFESLLGLRALSSAWR